MTRETIRVGLVGANAQAGWARVSHVPVIYRAVVVADGCSDKDAEVQRVLMEKIFPFQAAVATIEEVIGALP